MRNGQLSVGPSRPWERPLTIGRTIQKEVNNFWKWHSFLFWLLAKGCNSISSFEITFFWDVLHRFWPSLLPVRNTRDHILASKICSVPGLGPTEGRIKAHIQTDKANFTWDLYKLSSSLTILWVEFSHGCTYIKISLECISASSSVSAPLIASSPSNPILQIYTLVRYQAGQPKDTTFDLTLELPFVILKFIFHSYLVLHTFAKEFLVWTIARYHEF